MRLPARFHRPLAAAAFLVLALARPLTAQQVRGIVRDSASQRPIPGAVLIFFDSAGATLGRNITNERGQYVIALSREMRRMRVQRIGFRPRNVSLPASGTENLTLDIAMVSLPAFLEPVHVAANACPRRSDEGSALALLEQARAGLLTTVVAREANPASLLLLTFERTMEGTSDRIVRQKVRIDSRTRSTGSFGSAHTATDFVKRGFMDDGPGGPTFHGPDADVLLDDNFVSAYCFFLTKPERSRPNQVGLGFRAADRRRDRVDIEGALWIDTVARALRDIEFRYLGLDRRVEAFRPGGRVGFREMTNGMVLVDRWHLRLVGTIVDTILPAGDPALRPTGGGGPTLRTNFYVIEGGGELARAAWPDSHVWNASLGALHVRAVTDKGLPAVGTALRLADTDYRGEIDTTGDLRISNLVPGPYSLVVIEPRLAEIDVMLETPVKFVASRDSTINATFKVPTAEDYVGENCAAGRRYSVGDSTWVVGRVTPADGRPLGDSRVSVSREVALGDWREIDDYYRPGTDGLFWICSKQLRRGMRVKIEVRRAGSEPVEVERRLDERLTVVRIPLARR